MRRALCVGIDQYALDPLRGCVSDAESIASVLGRHQDGALNFDCRLLTAPRGAGITRVTRRVLREQLDQLFKDPADLVLFHFAGHGTINNLDGYLVTQDGTEFDEGIAMAHVLKLANDSKASEIVILLDCCYSGVVGNPPSIDNSRVLLREGVSILTASRGDQPSVEVGDGGIFTSLVRAALDGGAADILGSVTAPGIYAYVEAALGAFEQRPLFKSHVSQLLSIRNCTPRIDRSILRNLPMLFPLPAEDFPLDPSYVPEWEVPDNYKVDPSFASESDAPDKHKVDPSFASESDAPDKHKVDLFLQLRALKRVQLVIPVDAPHMYGAARLSKSCRLTPSGRYYWRLAKSGRI